VCLVVLAWESHPEYRLVLAANRDEFHQRPAQALHWWPDRPAIVAGRDLQAGGTWLAVSRAGRFATVTNYRERRRKSAGLYSRGELVTNFVGGDQDARTFFETIGGERYAGFSLLASDGDELWYLSNRGDGPDRLPPGIYGLSNASLDTPWPKLERCRDALRSMIESGAVNESALMNVLTDRTTAPAEAVETGGLPFDVARALTAPFIVSPDYGTRCTTVLTWDRENHVNISEHRFDQSGRKTGESRVSFRAGDNQDSA
jgi:uncharacterized protein with NRDE domain